MPNRATLTIALPPETARRLAELAAEEGGSPEALAAEAVADMVNLAFADGPERLKLSPEQLRASLEAQMREIEAGNAVTYSHEQVMAEARAIMARRRRSVLSEVRGHAPPEPAPACTNALQ